MSDYVNYEDVHFYKNFDVDSEVEKALERISATYNLYALPYKTRVILRSNPARIFMNGCSKN
jgi:hypothetical protein